jgi:DNA-binding FadR family transcriptional regulator
MQEHRRMLDAIVASDAPLAVELIHAHLQGVDSYWRGLIDDASPGAPSARRADS